MSKLEERPVGRMEVRAPRRFAWPALLVFSAYGFLLLLPALFAMVMVSTLPFTLWTYTIPLLALAFATLLLPFGFGNGYAMRLARHFKPDLPGGQEPSLVQITFSPRLRSGLRSVLEDADDIGWLSWSDTALEFHGDSVDLTIPLDTIHSMRLQNSGFRAMFLYSRLCVELSPQSPARAFWLAERSAFSLPGSRAAARKLFNDLCGRVPASRPAATVG